MYQSKKTMLGNTAAAFQSGIGKRNYADAAGNRLSSTTD